MVPVTAARCLVTGGAGFIGSHVCETLVREGASVRVLDDLSTGKRANLHAVADRIEFMEGKVENPDDARRAVRDADTVVHLAAIPSVVRSVEDPVGTDRVNSFGTLQMLIAARDACVRRFVNISSCAVYGENPDLPVRETALPAPASPYALSKLTGEHHCRIFSRLFGLSTVSLRLFNVFGPRQDPSSPYSGVISIFLRQLLARERPTIFGDGEQSRDFVYVGNVVAAIEAACAVDEARGPVFNIGTGTRRSLNDLYAALRGLALDAGDPVYADARAGDVRHSQADVSLARDLLGYLPAVGFEEGLRETLRSLSPPC